MNIVIVNYNGGNIGSVINILKYIDVSVSEVNVCTRPEELETATHIILPGVGAFDQGMKQLEKLNLISALHKAKNKGIPILGICLGMQIMTKGSEEGKLSGLGWIDAVCEKFESNLTIPHIGWEYIKVDKNHKSFLTHMSEQNHIRYYFIHSFHVQLNETTEKDALMATAKNNDFIFTAAFKKENLIGVQFHPEKSHRYGMDFFRYFLSLVK